MPLADHKVVAQRQCACYIAFVMSAERKICVITGANTGIGRVTAIEMANRGYHTLLCCRSRERARAVLDEISQAHGDAAASFAQLDLGDLSNVRRSAETVAEQVSHIDVLINNAGIAGSRGLTADGFEMAFGINHVGHFLFTDLLLEQLKAAPAGRIVNVSSRAHYKADRIDYDAVRQSTKSITGLAEYQVSKLANVLFTVELARRLEGSRVTTYAVHPGVVASDVWRRVPWPASAIMKCFMISNEEGALTSLHCATSPDAASENGLYYDQCAPKKPNPVVHDEAMASELWQRSEAWVRA